MAARCGSMRGRARRHERRLGREVGFRMARVEDPPVRNRRIRKPRRSVDDPARIGHGRGVVFRYRAMRRAGVEKRPRPHRMAEASIHRAPQAAAHDSKTIPRSPFPISSASSGFHNRRAAERLPHGALHRAR